MFLDAEFANTSESVLLISHRLWQARFGSSDSIVGRTLRVDGAPVRVIGVLPPDFDFFPGSDMLAPLRFAGPSAYDEFARTLEVFGSLKTGVQLSTAAWGLTATTERFRPKQIAIVESVRERLFRGFAPTVRVLTLVSLVILAVCCLNFATLLTVRSADRHRELAVRTALGAGRGRIVRQLVTEALVLSIAGGAAGVLVAQLGRGAVAGNATGGVLSSTPVLDWRVFGFAALLTIGTGVLFSIGPARRATATVDLDVALKDGMSSRQFALSKPRWFASNWLAGSIQLALTMMLLVGAGLLVKSIARIQAFDPGYDGANAVTLRFDVPPTRYRSDADVAQFVGKMTERVGALPGVEVVGATSSLPYAAGALQMRMVMFEESVRVSGRPEAMPLGWIVPPPPPPPPGMAASPVVEHFPALSCEVDPAFFRAMRIPLLMGREFTPFDNCDIAAGGHHQPGDGRPLLVWSESNWPPDAARTALSMENDHRRGRQYSALRPRRCHSVGVRRAIRAGGRSTAADDATHWSSCIWDAVRDAQSSHARRAQSLERARDLECGERCGPRDRSGTADREGIDAARRTGRCDCRTPLLARPRGGIRSAGPAARGHGRVCRHVAGGQSADTRAEHPRSSRCACRSLEVACDPRRAGSGWNWRLPRRARFRAVHSAARGISVPTSAHGTRERSSR